MNLSVTIVLTENFAATFCSEGYVTEISLTINKFYCYSAVYTMLF